MFVTVDDTIYIAAFNLNQTQMWSYGSTAPTRIFYTSVSAPYDTFVATNGDVYVESGMSGLHVDRWVSNGTIVTTAMLTQDRCYGLFVDIHDDVYCAEGAHNQVFRHSSTDPLNVSTAIAGDRTAGSAPNMLNGPRGIFVGLDLKLYVADCFNNRVQCFSNGHQNGATVAGSGASATITLQWPNDVILDADGYLFIVEFYIHRVVGSGPHGFRCIAGCTGTAGSSSNQLSNPTSLSFDTMGNLFVADYGNSRVQKFQLVSQSCGSCNR